MISYKLYVHIYVQYVCIYIYIIYKWSLPPPKFNMIERKRETAFPSAFRLSAPKLGIADFFPIQRGGLFSIGNSKHSIEGTYIFHTEFLSQDFLGVKKGVVFSCFFKR